VGVERGRTGQPDLTNFHFAGKGRSALPVQEIRGFPSHQGVKIPRNARLTPGDSEMVIFGKTVSTPVRRRGSPVDGPALCGIDPVRAGLAEAPTSIGLDPLHTWTGWIPSASWIWRTGNLKEALNAGTPFLWSPKTILLLGCCGPVLTPGGPWEKRPSNWLPPVQQSAAGQLKGVAHALLRAASRLFSTPALNTDTVPGP
jgi:hypothetical protein